MFVTKLVVLRINKAFSNVRQHDANILKFDEELETLRSAIVENYSNVVPKKIKICSTIRKPSRHKRTSEIELEILVVGQKFQTVEPQESEIIFETNHFVFEEPKISCYQIESYIECTKEKQPVLHIDILNGLQNGFNAIVSFVSLSLKNVATLFREALTRKCHPTLTKLLENGNLLIKFLL